MVITKKTRPPYYILGALLLLFTSATQVNAELNSFREQVLQTAAVATGNGTMMSVDKFTAIGLEVTISNTATVTFEGSSAGAVFSAVTCSKTSPASSVSTATATGLYQCNIAGLTAFRARISAYTSGTVDVFARASTAVLGGGIGGTVAIDQSVPGTTNGVTLTTLISGEDQTNDLIKISGGAVRSTTVASGLLIAADCTSHCTPAAYVALPVGSKTFSSSIASATSGDTIVKQTHTIYAGNTNTFTSDDAVQVCQITFNATTQYLTKAFVQSCPPVTGNWLYYGVISSNTGSGAGVVTGAVTATY